MQIVYADRVKETTTTTGTGSYTLAGAAAGFQSFAAIGDGKQCPYVATNGADWECGFGTYTAAGTTLSRTTILASSNAGAAVNWGVGSKDVFCDLPALAMVPFAHSLDPAVWDIASGGAPQVLNGAIFAVGAYSAANGTSAIAVGATATGTSALQAGWGSQANGNFAVAIGGGTQCQATAANAIAIGGTDTSTFGAKASAASAVAVGSATNATGVGSACVGGGTKYAVGNTASGVDSACVGGDRNQATGKGATTHGYNAKARRFGSVAQGGGDSTATAGAGACQSDRVVQRKTTADATTTALEFDADAATNGYLTLPANFAAAVVAHVVGRQSSTGDSIAFRLEGLVHTDGAGVPSLVGSTPAAVDLGHSAGAATWTAALAVDGVTNNCLLVNVTGEAAKTVKWVARIELVEVGA